MTTPEQIKGPEQPCSSELAAQVHDKLIATLGIVGVGATAEAPFSDGVHFSQVPYELHEVSGMVAGSNQEYEVSLAPGNNSIPYTEAEWPGGICIRVEDFGDASGRNARSISTYFEPGYEDDGTPTIRKYSFDIPKLSLVDRMFPQSCPIPVGGYQKAVAEAQNQLASLQQSAALEEATGINRVTNKEARGLLELLNSF